MWTSSRMLNLPLKPVLICSITFTYGLSMIIELIDYERENSKLTTKTQSWENSFPFLFSLEFYNSNLKHVSQHLRKFVFFFILLKFTTSNLNMSANTRKKCILFLFLFHNFVTSNLNMLMYSGSKNQIIFLTGNPKISGSNSYNGNLNLSMATLKYLRTNIWLQPFSMICIPPNSINLPK